MTMRKKQNEAQRSEYERRFDLGAMFEFSTIINSSLDLNFILGHLLLTIMGKLLSLRGVVLLRKEESDFVVETVRGIPPQTIGERHAWSALPNRLVYVRDARKEPWVNFFRRHGIDIVVPLSVQEKVLGIVGFAPASSAPRLGKTQETYVKSLANIAAGAIAKGLVVQELSDVNRRLDGKIQELKTLFEVSKEFNGILDADQIVKLLLYSIMGQIGTSKYALFLKKDGRMKPVASRLSTELPGNVEEFLLQATAPVLVNELSGPRKKKLAGSFAEAGIEAIIPLQVQQETKGMLALGAKLHGGAYAPADIEFVTSLGNLALISLENARLFSETIEKQKLEDELAIAKEIQRALLPARLPAIPGFDVAATNISSKQVGGDYYDVIPLGEGKFMVAIGDVSGKGTPAALLMANLQATIRALVHIRLPLGEITMRVNNLICENTTGGRFITFFWLILDAASGKLSYVNAGHNPPVALRANGDVERLFSGGIIFGIVPSQSPYEEGTVTLHPGDTLILFTDGITEAMDAAGVELGEEPLLRLARLHTDVSPQEIIDGVVGTVQSHSRGIPQSDDVTLVVLRAL